MLPEVLFLMPSSFFLRQHRRIIQLGKTWVRPPQKIRATFLQNVSPRIKLVVYAGKL